MGREVTGGGDKVADTDGRGHQITAAMDTESQDTRWALSRKQSK